MHGCHQFSTERSAEILQIIQEMQDKFGVSAVKAVRQGEIVPRMQDAGAEREQIAPRQFNSH